MASNIQRLSDDIDDRDLPVDAIVETLTDRRCRNVLEHFVRDPGSAYADELAACFSCPGAAGRDAVGHDADGDDADSNELHERAALRLHHVVLPKLADAGLIRYDPAENVAELAESPARVDEYLRRTGRYGLA